MPAFNITGLTSTDQPNSQALTLDTNFQWTDNLSWTRGRHSMKFGFDAIRDQLGVYNYPNSIYGSYNFTCTYTGPASAADLYYNDTDKSWAAPLAIGIAP